MLPPDWACTDSDDDDGDDNDGNDASWHLMSTDSMPRALKSLINPYNNPTRIGPLTTILQNKTDTESTSEMGASQWET